MTTHIADHAANAGFQIAPVDAPLGAQVLGFDGSLDARPEQILALKRALLDHHILIFKHQRLDDTAFKRLATSFGSVYAPPADAPVLASSDDGTVPEIVLVSNVDDGVLGNIELPAHSDHHWTPLPSSGSLLYALEVPQAGGDTTWYNLAAAYDALSESLRERLDRLRLITYNPFLRRKHPLPEGFPLYRRPGIEPLRPFIDHPLVRTHPDSGRKLLYLGARTEVELVGYDPDAGADLIAQLREHILSPRFAYRHRWSVGDIVFWDNQITLHGRDDFDSGERRVLKRISLAGSRPF
ncbi:Taurine dioxygenase [Paraburkholderia unamae]|uniref:TauD/TfdA dioxygenase family protein n=1 Tax=Paraburkholderia unamae TaxID=219649 RepID=UPI001CB2A7EC|nr:TauD/TfdA family dioxygenase [Paraburkholderia unamae]CAG9271285.1 Taurine dioxygenase [Paraburkholderia unamae]